MTVYAIEVDHPIRGWVRMQGKDRSKEAAKSWRPFVRAAWHGLPTRVVKVEVPINPESPCPVLNPDQQNRPTLNES